MSCRRCASSPARIRSSTARGCSPPATPTWSATGSSSSGSGLRPKRRPELTAPEPAPAASSALPMNRAGPALEAAPPQLAQRQLRRERTTVAARAAEGRRVILADRSELVDFSSNDYLGLARHPALAAAMSACAARAGTGSRASHLITGHGPEHGRLEEELAAFCAPQPALLF